MSDCSRHCFFFIICGRKCFFSSVWAPECEAGQEDVAAMSECVLHYLRDLPSPVIPACIYPQLQTAVTLQQQALQQSTGAYSSFMPLSD